jgi:hypothetical protein
MAPSLVTADAAGRAPSHHTLGPADRPGRIAVERSVLFAGHAEGPSCRAFVRRLTPLGPRSVIGELVAGWCSVCCTATSFRG